MIKKLLKKIEDNNIIKLENFDDCDIDELLDKRDDEVFDGEWIKAYSELNKNDYTDAEKKEIDVTREKSFLMAYNNSGSSDIASCVSDDMEIICKAYFMNYNNAWLNSLIMSYAHGEFPCGKLENEKKDIKDCISILVK